MFGLGKISALVIWFCKLDFKIRNIRGDGDYGKLGRGGSDGCKIPTKIESLSGLGIIKVECGSQVRFCQFQVNYW